MKQTWVIVLALILSMAFKASAGDSIKDDMERLQGEWIPVKWIIQGREIPSQKEQTNFIFAGNKLTANQQKGTFTIDPLKKPKTMEVTLPLLRGTWSYQLVGDTLTIAFGKVGGKAPSDFEGNDGHFVLILKRKAK